MNTEIKYLELLSKSFKNIAETSTEIINLQAIMNLPKGTEHFMTFMENMKLLIMFYEMAQVLLE